MNALQAGGFFFTPTTLMPLIVADLGLPLSLSTVPIAVGKAAYVLLLIPGGMLVDRYGPRRCVLTGITGLAVLMTLYSIFVSSFWVLVFAHISLASVASISSVPVYSVFIAQWFQDNIGLAMGLVLAGFSAAGTTVPALLGPVAGLFGWRVGMGGMCVLLWFVGLPVSYAFLKEYRNDQVPVGDPEKRELFTGACQEVERRPLIAQEETGQEAGPLICETGMVKWKSWTFVGFAFSYILMQYCFGCFGENIMFFLILDCGMTTAHASLYFSVLNLSALTAKLGGGYMGDRVDRFRVASVSCGLAAVGVLFLFINSFGLDENNIPRLTEQPLAVLMFTVVFGFGYGATFNCLYALIPIVFGKRNLGRTQSALFGLGLAGNAVGSVITAVLRSRYKTYQRPFLASFVACAANFLIFNITRMTLRGSPEGLQKLGVEQGGLVTSGTFLGSEELGTTPHAVQ